VPVDRALAEAGMAIGLPASGEIITQAQTENQLLALENLAGQFAARLAPNGWRAVVVYCQGRVNILSGQTKVR
jgi:hypothetical protein